MDPAKITRSLEGKSAPRSSKVKIKMGILQCSERCREWHWTPIARVTLAVELANARTGLGVSLHHKLLQMVQQSGCRLRFEDRHPRVGTSRAHITVCSSHRLLVFARLKIRTIIPCLWATVGIEWHNSCEVPGTEVVQSKVPLTIKWVPSKN